MTSFTDVTEHVTITVQGDDSNYFVHEDWEFNRKPVALGMETGKTCTLYISYIQMYYYFYLILYVKMCDINI